MEKWFVTAKKADFNAWSKKFHITPVTARIIRNRDIFSEEEVEKFLNGTFLDLYPPELMLDMEDAAAIIEEQLHVGKKIRVIGDYDVDGISASFILTKGLKVLSADVDTVIPHRMKNGYGLSQELIEEAYEDGIRTIITCDNGIAASAQIAFAVEKKMTVVVTDHHEVPFETTQGERIEILPPAAAIVDPKRQDCHYPYKNICGAVVAYKLIELLFRRSDLEPEEKQKHLDEFLQMAAMATVCDVMDLLDENRIIVKEGLSRMKKNPCLGIRALMEVNGIEPRKLTAFHLGFVLGPCVNATGRLDTAKRALALLEAPDRRTAVTIAGELKEMNDSRKVMTLSGLQDAIKNVEQNHMDGDRVLVIYLPECHESIAGIIAGRMREKYGKPVFILTRSGEEIKGSGRSIESYNMYEAMCACKELFTKFGGHKMAAGLSMEERNIPLLREKLNAECNLVDEDFITKVRIDVPMPLHYANQALAEELGCLEPFGTGNPRPLFATKEVHFHTGKKIGAKGNFAKYTVEEAGKEYQLTFFGNLEDFHVFLDDRFGKGSADKLYQINCDYCISITYQLSLNTYMGKTEVQLLMQNYC
ncbi:MAG TPA: single-stranded-DNA-specific exonuclease RecJ [Lachnospiraceae bacterium]|nr:single-stranded-DNA-specific exonuclease RecJ [Lachnospiraceae bacterium]